MSPPFYRASKSRGASRCCISACLAPNCFAPVLQKCSIPCIDCIHSFGAGARRCSIPFIPCIHSFGAGAVRCSIPCNPYIHSFGAGDRICSFGAGARRCSIPCILCMTSRKFRAGAARGQILDPSHSLHLLLCSLESSHQGRSAATASSFAAFCAQGYHSCSRPGHSSAPCAVASLLSCPSRLRVITVLGSVHSPP